MTRTERRSGGTFTVRINDEHVARVFAARRQLRQFNDQPLKRGRQLQIEEGKDG